MTQDDLLNRLSRIYAALDEVVESDLTQFVPQVTRVGDTVILFNDFAGGLSEHQIQNVAQSVIANIASLADHLKRWARINKKNADCVNDLLRQSVDLQILTDLWNNDKHGYSANKDGRKSNRPRIHHAPILKKVKRTFRMTTRSEKGSKMIFSLDAQGRPVVSGDGTGGVIITGEVVDSDGSYIDDLFDIQKRAVEAWETLLHHYGVFPQSADDTV